MAVTSDQPSSFVGESWYAGSGQPSDEVDGREGWLPGVLGLFS